MQVIIFVDASFCLDTRVCAFGYYIACDRGRKQGGRNLNVRPHFPHEAETLAIANALYQAIKYNLVYKHDHVTIRTDCNRSILAYQDQIKNLSWSEERAIDYFRKVCEENDLTYNLKHIKAHSGTDTPEKYAHNKCDQYAKVHMNKAREQYTKDLHERSRKKNKTHASRRRKRGY